jgi:hypothetical protein
VVSPSRFNLAIEAAEPKISTERLFAMVEPDPAPTSCRHRDTTIS